MLQKLRKERGDEGFTLIELLVVIIIIGILAAIAIPVFLSQRKKAVDASMKADLRNVATVVETYATDHEGSYPVDTDVAQSANTVTIQSLPDDLTQLVSNGNDITYVQQNSGASFCMSATRASDAQPSTQTLVLQERRRRPSALDHHVALASEAWPDAGQTQAGGVEESPLRQLACAAANGGHQGRVQGDRPTHRFPQECTTPTIGGGPAVAMTVRARLAPDCGAPGAEPQEGTRTEPRPDVGQADAQRRTWADVKNGPVPRWWPWVAVTLVAVYVHILLLVTGWKGLDLGVYRAGGRAILTGIPLYSDAFDSTSPSNLRWTYSPFGALVMTVWTLPPFNVAYVLWTVMSTWCLWGLVHIAGEGLWSKAATQRGQLLIKFGLLALGLMCASVVDGRHLGQVGVLIVFSVVFDWAGPRVSWLPRGLLTGVAAAIKVTPGFFIVWLVVARRWRDAAVAVSAFGVATLIGAVVRWADSWQYLFGGVLSNPERVGHVFDVMNQSLWGLFHHPNTRLDGGIAEALWLVSALLVGVLALLTATELERAGSTLKAVLVIGLATVLMSPVSWLHHGVWASLP